VRSSHTQPPYAPGAREFQKTDDGGRIMATAAGQPHATKQARRAISLVNPAEGALTAYSGLRPFSPFCQVASQAEGAAGSDDRRPALFARSARNCRPGYRAGVGGPFSPSARCASIGALRSPMRVIARNRANACAFLPPRSPAAAKRHRHCSDCQTSPGFTGPKSCCARSQGCEVTPAEVLEQTGSRHLRC
jgi:hypothetical protein